MGDPQSNCARLLCNFCVSQQDLKDDLIVVCTWLPLTVYALVANILVIIGIGSNVVMRNSTSYWLIISLCVCDLCMVMVSFFHPLPATAFHDAFLDFNSLRNLLMVFTYDVFWYTEVVHLGMMAVNRYVSIVSPTYYEALFSTERMPYLLAFSYLLGLAVSIPTLFPCCHILWDSYYYTSTYTVANTWFKHLDLAINATSLAVMVFSYTIIFFKVREVNRRCRQQTVQKHNSIKQYSKKELALFIQFFAASVSYLLTWTTWQWMPHISTSKWMSFAMSTLFFVYNSMNPTIHFVFNRNLRKRVCELFCRKHDVEVCSVQNIALKPGKFKCPVIGNWKIRLKSSST
ncbi:hypothetical protein Aduo_007270 [Ancylostoma duodenale]